MKTLLELKELSKIYPSGEEQVYALNQISLSIRQGEFVAIVGQSGSGKSTLMNILGCLDIPTSGSYYLDGKNVASLNENQLALIRNEEIGFIFQGFNLISSLSALENVELPLVYRGMPKQERREISQQALERVGLGSRIHHLPAEMSGGQQQRVAIARALIAKPDIIFADEPTGNLDSKSGSEVMEMLQNIWKKMGKTLVIITHDSRIARMADRQFVIVDGVLSEVTAK